MRLEPLSTHCNALSTHLNTISLSLVFPNGVTIKELMAERDYALRVAKRPGNQEQWNEYGRLKNFAN